MMASSTAVLLLLVYNMQYPCHFGLSVEQAELCILQCAKQYALLPVTCSMIAFFDTAAAFNRGA